MAQEGIDEGYGGSHGISDTISWIGGPISSLDYQTGQLSNVCINHSKPLTSTGFLSYSPNYHESRMTIECLDDQDSGILF